MAHDHAHGGSHGGAHGEGEAHASVGFYWMIGGVLAVLTAMEVAVFYIEALTAVEVPVLLTITAAKFILVVMFFMHLRYDSKVFTGLFLAGLVLATFMISALVALYHFLPALERGAG
jgi:cytochrome c oxidase subunit IV